MTHNPFLQSRARTLVSGYHGTAVTVLPSRREGLYIVDCSGVAVTVNARCAKAGLEACSDISLYLNSTVVTEMCEITNCSNVDLYISPGVTLRTITIDMCSGVNLHVQDAADQLYKIYYHQSHGTTLVKHEGGPVQKTVLDRLALNNERQVSQFVCRIHADGHIQRDIVVREAKGYPTTEAELAAAGQDTVTRSLQRIRDQLVLISMLDEDSEPSDNSPP